MIQFLRSDRRMISSTGILTISLSAICANWRKVKSTLVGGAECAAVVKADAYGVGAEQVACALHEAGCRHFYLATFEEAYRLRKLMAQDAVLYVFGGAPVGNEGSFVENNLIPVLYTLDALYAWSEFCHLQSCNYPCVIKLDTGMSRLGLSSNDVEILLNDAKLQSNLNPLLIMSHLACADEPSHPLNLRQLNDFREKSAALKAIFQGAKLSLANSSGVFLGEDYHFDMVRIGAALYGINPQPASVNPLHATIQLMLPVLQTRAPEEQVTVGYGASGDANSEVKLAVVAGGYADGLNRILGSSPRGHLNGELLNSVGRMSMDSFIFALSRKTETPSYISVIDDVLNLDTLINDNKLLGYEVLTSLGRRFQRRYIKDAK